MGLIKSIRGSGNVGLDVSTTSHQKLFSTWVNKNLTMSGLAPSIAAKEEIKRPHTKI
jgi:hypothetical protein